MTDPPIRLVEHFVRRKLQALTALHLPDNRQSVPVGRPIGPFDVFPDLARSAADQGYPRERAGIKELRSGVTPKRKRHSARRGDGQNVGSRRSQLLRLRALRPSREKFEWLPFPSSAVNDCLPIGSKTRGVDNATTEGERVVDRKRSLRWTLKQEHSHGETGNERNSGSHQRR